MIEKKQFYIDGAWVEPVVANDFDVIDPATEEACAIISLGSAVDVDKAVAAARNAFESWAATPLAERRDLFIRLGEIMDARIGELAEAMMMEMGAPLDMANDEQATCGPWHLKGFLKAIENFQSEQTFKDGQTIVREPIGVCGLITPWNWPVNQIALKVVPALLTGCTCVLKPSEIAPLSALVFAEFMHEAGFPGGVFNLVNGDGANVGRPYGGIAPE